MNIDGSERALAKLATPALRRWIGAAACVLGVASTVAAAPQTAYTNARIETMGEQGCLEGATLLIDGGRIVDVGIGLRPPRGARVIDARGKTLMPGIVDPYHVQGGRGGGAAPRGLAAFGGRGGRGGGARPGASGPFRRVAEDFYPYDTDFSPLVRHGITTANLVIDGHGQSAYARIEPDFGEDMIFEGDGLLFAAVSNDSTSLDLIRDGLAGEEVTATEEGEAEATPTAGGGRGGFGGGRGGFGGGGRGGRGGGGTSEAAAEKANEAWKAVREGARPILLNANNTAAVQHLLKVLASHDKVRVGLIASGGNLYEVLDEVAAAGATVLLEPSLDSVPYTTEQVSVARLLHEQGRPFVFSLSMSSGQFEASQDDPLFAVAWLVRAGLPREVALRALTLEPARLLGIDEELGSLEKGKAANVLIFDGDPLETGSRLETVLVEGEAVDGL